MTVSTGAPAELLAFEAEHTVTCAGCGTGRVLFEGDFCRACGGRRFLAQVKARFAALPRAQVLADRGVPAKYRHPFEPLAAWPRDPRVPAFDPLAWTGRRPWLVLLHGEVGVGKTFAAVELLYRICLHSQAAGRLYVRAGDVPAIAFGDDPEAWRWLLDAEALVVDDIGRGYHGNAQAAISTLFAHREENELPTIGTTNAKSEAEMCGEDAAMADRLRTGVHLNLSGTSRRVLAVGPVSHG